MLLTIPQTSPPENGDYKVNGLHVLKRPQTSNITGWGRFLDIFIQYFSLKQHFVKGGKSGVEWGPVYPLFIG